MSYTNQDWRVAITNLLKKSLRDEIDWEISDLFAGDAWTEVDRSFKSQIGNKVYVISRTRRKHYVDEEEFYWAGGFSFNIYEKGIGHKLLASAPEDISLLENLFDAAEKRFAFSSGALNDLL